MSNTDVANNPKLPAYVVKKLRKGNSTKKKRGGMKYSKYYTEIDNSEDLAWTTPIFNLVSPTSIPKRIFSDSPLYQKYIEEKNRYYEDIYLKLEQKEEKRIKDLHAQRSEYDDEYETTQYYSVESDDDDHPEFICDGCLFGCEYC